MNQYKLVQCNSVNEIILYFILFFTIILSRDTLFTAIDLGFFRAIIISFIFIIVITGILLIKNRIYYKKNIDRLYFSGILIASIIVISLLKLDFQMYIISIIFYCFTGLLFTYLYSFESFFSKFSNIMVLLSIFSLICTYGIRFILFPNGIINENIPMITNSEGLTFFNFKLCYVVALPYYVRNFGIFREPGVFQFFLMLPLIYELLIHKDKKRWFNIIVLLIAIISTVSTVGYFTMFLVLITYLIKTVKTRVITLRDVSLFIIFITLSIVIGVFLYFNNTQIYDIVNEFIKKITTINESNTARIGSLVTNLKIFFHNPILGEKFSFVQAASTHNTNSSFSLFAIFGSFIGIIHLILFYMLSQKSSKNIIVNILVFIILIISINTQFLIGNSLFWIIMFTPFMESRDTISLKFISITNILQFLSKIKQKVDRYFREFLDKNIN